MFPVYLSGSNFFLPELSTSLLFQIILKFQCSLDWKFTPHSLQNGITL